MRLNIKLDSLAIIFGNQTRVMMLNAPTVVTQSDETASLHYPAFDNHSGAYAFNPMGVLSSILCLVNWTFPMDVWVCFLSAPGVGRRRRHTPLSRPVDDHVTASRLLCRFNGLGTE